MSHRHIQQLGLIREEFDAARSSLMYVQRMWSSVHDAPEFRVERIELAKLNRALSNVSDTYIIKAFAEFENILRTQMSLIRPPRRIPRLMESLINRVAAIYSIPNLGRDNAHHVRDYRNSLVHDGNSAKGSLTFESALRALNRFLAVLPN